MKNKFKRLIKAEIYDGIQYDDEYWEIFKNPTSKEIKITKDKDPNNCVRGVILENGDLYIWPAEILHEVIGAKTSISVDRFRFAQDDNNWLIDAHFDYNIDDIIKMVLKNKNVLASLGNIDNEFMVVYFQQDDKINETNEDDDVYIDNNNIGYFYLKDVENKVFSRLAKQNIELKVGDNVLLKRHPYDKSIYEIKEILPDGTLFLDNGIAAITNINQSAVKLIN